MTLEVFGLLMQFKQETIMLKEVMRSFHLQERNFYRLLGLIEEYHKKHF